MISPPRQIAVRSKKRASQERDYSHLRKDFLLEHPMCQAHLQECTQYSSEVHHKAGRIGDNFLDVSTWLAVCNTCHKWIELNPIQAKELNFSLNRL